MKDIALTGIGLSCFFGFVTLLIQPNHLLKGMLLGAGVGLCISITATRED